MVPHSASRLGRRVAIAAVGFRAGTSPQGTFIPSREGSEDGWKPVCRAPRAPWEVPGQPGGISKPRRTRLRFVTVKSPWSPSALVQASPAPSDPVHAAGRCRYFHRKTFDKTESLFLAVPPLLRAPGFTVNH